MDHLFVANELARGLYGESACVTFRDRYADIITCEGTRDKSTEHVVNFLVQVRQPSEK